MKISHAPEIELERAVSHRGGTLHSRLLMSGEEGTLGNFQLTQAENGGDFFSPRHRHNFEQYRLQLRGVLDFGRDGKMTPGVIGYFPEGVYYGPQTQTADQTPAPLTCVLQFGGASGSGYIGRDEVAEGMHQLERMGEFKNGVFRRDPAFPGKKNMDAFQAIWEHLSEKPMIYPKPRYQKPILMDPANYDWVPTGEAGVSEKLMGVFTERRNECGRVKIDKGASFTARGRGLYFVVAGEGAMASGKYGEFTTLYLDAGETAVVKATTTTELVHFGLPNLSDLEKGREITAEAAE